jgi:hypothetical protein
MEYNAGYTLDTVAPNVTLYPPTPANNTAGDDDIAFNWTATDNIDTSIECYPVVDGVLKEPLYTPNGSHSNTTITLLGGNHSLKVTCFDNASNSVTSEERSYIAALINITLPQNDEIMRPYEKFRFNISVLAGSDWIQNVTLVVYNETLQTEKFSTTLYNTTYTAINLSPRYINATAYSFNNNDGPALNVSSRLRLRLARPAGETLLPRVSYVCPNESYTLNATNITIETKADADTLLESYNVSLILPNQETQVAMLVANYTDENFTMNFNFSFATTIQGEYMIMATVKDIENQTVLFNKSLVVSNYTKNVNVTNISVTSIIFKDVCTGNALLSGNVLVVPNVSYYDADVVVTAAIGVSLSNVSLSESVNNTLNYTLRTTETEPPIGKRRVELWDLVSNMKYNNGTVSYNYSAVEHTLIHESNLGIYLCKDMENCTLVKQNITLDQSLNRLAVELTNITARYMVTEPSLTAIPGDLANPSIYIINFSRTYINVNQTINITLTFNVSFLLNTVNLSVNSTPLTPIATNVSGKSYRYVYNYSPATKGPYLVRANVKDENTFESNKTAMFYVADNESISIRAIGVSNMTLKDITSKLSIAADANITTTLPAGRYDLFIEANKTDMSIFNASINSSVSVVLIFNDLPEAITAPADRINLDQFEVNSSIGFVSIHFTYNYSNLTSSITDEGNLEVHKCKNASNCTWSELDAVIDTTLNTISFSAVNLSIFDIVESIRTETETVTQTVTTSSGGGGGGGGATITRVAALDIIVPSPIALHTNDSITVPIVLKNKGQVRLNNINLSSVIKAEGIRVEIADTSFESLEINETVSTSIMIRTDATAIGRNEITITAGVKSPKLTESVDIIIDVIDKYKGNRTVVEEKLRFAADLFKNNPECLEFKELLSEAEAALEKNEFEKARVLAESAIDACRQLVGAEGFRPKLERPSKIGFKITLPLIIIVLLAVLVLLIYGIRNIRWRMPRLSLKVRKRRHQKIGPTKKELRSFESEEREIRKMLRMR